MTMTIRKYIKLFSYITEVTYVSLIFNLLHIILLYIKLFTNPGWYVFLHHLIYEQQSSVVVVHLVTLKLSNVYVCLDTHNITTKSTVPV